MSDGVKTLVDKWINDANFRTDIRKDPEGTVKKLNVTLDADELAAFKAINWSESDDALTARVNKLA